MGKAGPESLGAAISDKYLGNHPRLFLPLSQVCFSGEIFIGYPWVKGETVMEIGNCLS